MALYVSKQEFMVAAGKQTDFEAFSMRLLELLQKQGGFVRGSTLNSFGYPRKYALVSMWESREAARAFALSPALSTLLEETRPRDYVTPMRPLEAFEVVHRVTGQGEPKTGYLIDQSVPNQPAGNVKAFEDARLKLFEIRQKQAGGFVGNVLARFLGGGNRYMVLGAFTDAESEAAAASLPEIIQYFKEYGPAVIPISTESREPYEFIQDATGGSRQ